MLDLLPLLLGVRGIGRYRAILGVMALASLILGLLFVFNVNAQPNPFLHSVAIAFSLFLLLSIWIGFIMPSNSAFARSRLNQPRLILISITALALILRLQQQSGMMVFIWGEIIGAVLFINAIIFGLFSVMIRPKRWRVQCLKAVIYLCLAIFFVTDFIPEPDKPNLFLALVLIVFSISCLRLAFRRGRLTNASIPVFTDGPTTSGNDGPLIGDDGQPVPMTIRIWLTNSEQMIPYPYIAELWNFFSSTLSPHRANSGPTAHHATLECGSDIYISFCPQNDLAHLDPEKSSASNMKRAIRMDQHYRMPARWRMSYREDLELRGEPTHTIQVTNYSYERLSHFQKYARERLTYHITRQNCCTTVVDALEISIFGWYSRYRLKSILLIKLIINDLFWQASSLRFRAQYFAWTTTGLLKYSQAMSGLLQLPGSVR